MDQYYFLFFGKVKLGCVHYISGMEFLLKFVLNKGLFT